VQNKGVPSNLSEDRVETMSGVRGRTRCVVARHRASSRFKSRVAVVISYDHLNTRHFHTDHLRLLNACRTHTVRQVYECAERHSAANNDATTRDFKGRHYKATVSSQTPLQRRSGMARVVEGFHSFTDTPTHLSTNGMNHTCFCLPS